MDIMKQWKKDIGYSMSNGTKVASELQGRIVGENPTRFWLGHGSFITIEFGKDRSEEVKTRRGLITQQVGEWQLWVYLCVWRIDLEGRPLIGSDDRREDIQKILSDLPMMPLTKVHVLNDTFDTTLTFGETLELHLFSFCVQDQEHWKFFMPENKVFVAGPGAKWSYHDSNKPSPEPLSD